MTELHPQLADQIRTICTQNAAVLADALNRALGCSLELEPGEPVSYEAAALAEESSGAGLALLFQAGDQGAMLLLSTASGILPDWCLSPDASGADKLRTLAEELSGLLWPDEVLVERFAALPAEGLAALLDQAMVGAAACCLPLFARAGEVQSTLHLVWPLADPGAIFPPEPTEAPAAETSPPAPPAEEEDGFGDLPSYTRSMLRIKVPVMVTLAAKKQSIRKIVELGPGSIIKFDKSCDEMLELEVGGRAIAEGEAVKVGDKFGLRISSMVLPTERFEKLARPPRRGGS